MLQVDTGKITRCFEYNEFVFNTPLQLTLAIYIIYNQVGSAAWIGVGTMAIAMTVNLALSSTCKKLNEVLMKIRDQRMEKSTELLTEIKMIKAYS